MSFMKITQDLLNETLTENGDKAYVSTLSPCLDYFSLCGGKRDYLDECLNLFIKAFYEDKNTALKLLIYTRDIRKGLGERKMFRLLFNALANSYPEIARKLLPYIPKYGRYDDLLVCLYTPLEDDVIEMISLQLDEDLKNKKEGKPISLLAKWLPSINTSNYEARLLALHLTEKLNLTKADYRKTLSYLRKNLILENDLRTSNYEFDYEKVPSVAMNKYRKAFNRNDQQRFEDYIASVKKGDKEMHVDVLDVVNLVKRAKESMLTKDLGVDYYDVTWAALTKDAAINKRTLVVRDGSGSMSCVPNALDIADAMALLTASRLEGEFKDKFITFSSEPKFVDLSNKANMFDKLGYLSTFTDYTNTDIEKVYQLILDVYKSPKFKSEDSIDQLLIISDMEFDVATDSQAGSLKSTFENFKNAFASLGFKMPEIVFWNVNARGYKVPVTQKEEHVKLVSGSSKNVIDLVTSTPSLNPLDFMNTVLEKYSFIDEIMK